MKKERKRKALAATVCGSMLAIALVGGTLAYLSDTDSDVNVMTLGNVDIVQHEQQYAEDGQTLEPFVQGKDLYPGTEIDKIVTVENTGKSDVYFRTLVAFEDIDSETFGIDINMTEAMNYYNVPWDEKDWYSITVDDTNYIVGAYTYKGVLAQGETSEASLKSVELSAKSTNEDMDALGGTYEILVLSQAVQVDGFADAKTAFDAAFGEMSVDNIQAWFTGDEFSVPTAVEDAPELIAALEAGESVYLTKDIENVDANTAITVAAGKEATLNLNGHKITASANKTGNQELFLVKGTLNVNNGAIKLTAENNQGWNSMATIFDVTAGGVLNMEGVTANTSGTDMNFIVHLNNWGKATANINNCDFTATYVAVRAFNSGYDMNNVTIKNTNFHNGRVFWVHNYTSEGKDDSTLNLDIYGNNNTTDNEKPVRFGFSNPVYYDIDGNEIA